MQILQQIPSASIDTVFADPPFNLAKSYGPGCSDDLTELDYVVWCHKWIDECIRVLKPGGSFFCYNIPKWNIRLGSYLMDAGLVFRHDIAIEQKNGMPIANKLFPAHYSLLYFSKGRQNTFNKIRTPVELCRHCDGEIRDYGGHRDSMNENGVSLKDVWTDITPVRHKKYQNEKRKANALSTKILDRVVEMSTNVGDVVLDPFGGSGTTYAVCESKGRRWIGIEIDFCDAIIDRLANNTVEAHLNTDIVQNIKTNA